MRSEPSSPVVTGAVRTLPLASFQRASLVPLRTMNSEPMGRGLVKLLRRTLPIVALLSLAEFQPDVFGECVGFVESEGLIAPKEPHDAGPDHPGFSFDGGQGKPALDDGGSQDV